MARQQDKKHRNKLTLCRPTQFPEIAIVIVGQREDGTAFVLDEYGERTSSREANARRERIILIPVEQPTNQTKEWRITTAFSSFVIP